jgi:hypothetical protein
VTASSGDQKPLQQAFDALLSEFRVAINHDRSSLSSHYRFKKLDLLIVGALLSSAVALGAVGFTWGKRNYSETQGSLEAPLNRDAEFDGVPTPAISMSALQHRDIPSIKQAMASCDAEAADNPNGLYFLVTPVAPDTFEGATSLLPSGANIGSLSFMLSQDLLNGLERGDLAVSARPYDFSIIDMVTAQTIKWSARGPSKFKQEYAPEVSQFQLGFNLGTNSLMSTPPFNRQKGNCYWVNVRFPALPLRTQGNWATVDMPNFFSLPYSHF